MTGLNWDYLIGQLHSDMWAPPQRKVLPLTSDSFCVLLGGKADCDVGEEGGVNMSINPVEIITLGAVALTT